VCFDRPGVAVAVFLFLTSDGLAPGKHQRPTVTLYLVDTSGSNHSLGVGFKGERGEDCARTLTLLSYSMDQELLKHGNHAWESDGSQQSSDCVNNFGKQNLIFIHIERFGIDILSICAQRPCGEQGRCTPLILDHADMVNCTSSGPGHMKCSITCQKGYVLQTSNGQYLRTMQKGILLTCSSGHWDKDVSCTRLDCGFPDSSLVNYANFSCLEGTDFLKRCFISCVPPAKLQGLSPWLTCLEDGLWTLPEVYCKLECDAPPVIPNANLLLPHCLEGNHDVGTICKYECKPGYYVMESTGSRGRNKFLKIQCLDDGTWEQRSCIPVVCEPPPPVFEGMYECTDGFKLDSQCVLNCNQETERTPILCTKEGLWTQEFKLCENLQGECPPPPPELNSVEYKCGQGYGIGAVCSPSCVVPPSDPVMLPENVTTDTLEHWMEPVKVQSIVCTGRRQWHPDPSLVYCIQSCETEYYTTAMIAQTRPYGRKHKKIRYRDR
ncbi:hypothetical protein STEG23_004408, partial [Scotinomys teguina]